MTYLFKGGRYAVSGETAAQAVAERWGQVRNAFAAAAGIDAAYTDGAGLYVLLGDQIIRYADCIENGGVRVDEGYPRRLEQHFTDLPAEFESGLEAAFAEPGSSRVHLFKDGRTVSPAAGDKIVRRVDKRWGQLGPVLPTGSVDAAFVGVDGRTYLFSGDRCLRYTGADYSRVDAGYPRRIAAEWAGIVGVDAAFVLDGTTHVFGTPGELFRIPVAEEFEWTAHVRRLDAGDIPPELRERLLEHGLRAADARVEGAGTEWTVPIDGGARVVVRREADALSVTAVPSTTGQFCVRYSGPSYTRPDPGYPRPLTDDWWNLPDTSGAEATFDRVDAVFTGRDGRTYLFAGGRFVVFDNRRRWWSEPKSLATDWDSIPFERVDAAFLGTDGKTYVFREGRYVRYSGDDYTRVDDRYPKAVTSYWGNVANPITRSGHVDAALVLQSPPEVEGGPERTHTYLFSGRQYVRYEGTDYATVDDGYPRDIGTSLTGEPRFANLTVALESGIDAAVADRRSVYLFTGGLCHVVSAALYRSYEHLPLRRAGCAFLEDGAVTVEDEAGWHRFTALEAEVVEKSPVRPRALRSVPEHFRTGLDAVLDGTDGNTYLFKGRACYDVALGREFPTAEDWGRPRNTVAEGEGVSAAFVGRDGKTYVFGGDQFVTYSGTTYAGVEVDGHPRPVAEHWGGLTAVALAYVDDGVTYLFEPPDAGGDRRVVVYSGSDYTQPDPGYPQVAGPDFWGVPPEYRGAEPFPVAVLFDRENTLFLGATQYVQHNATSGAWSYPRPLARLWPGVPLGTASAPLRSAFTGADGATYFFSRDEFTRSTDGVFSAPEPIPARWGNVRNTIASAGREKAVDAAFVWGGETTYLFSGDQYVRYSGPSYRYVDPGYPKSVVDDLRDEECFAHLPEAFEEVLADRVAAGEQTVIDAVLANRRTVYLFVDRFLHVVSQALEATYDLSGLGRVRNNVADTGRVDASFVRGDQTFLFSGDQYVRYTGPEYAFVDEGYPRSIAARLPDEVGVDGVARGVPRRDRRGDHRPGRPRVPLPRAPLRGHRGARAGRPAGRRDVGHGAQPVPRRPLRPRRRRGVRLPRGEPVRVQGRPVPALRDTDGRTCGRRLPPLDQGRLGGPPDHVRGGDRRRVRLRGRDLLRPRPGVRALLGRRLPPDRPDVPAAAGAPMGSVGGLPARRPARHLAVQAAAGPHVGRPRRPGRGAERGRRHGGALRPAGGHVRLERRRADVAQAAPGVRPRGAGVRGRGRPGGRRGRRRPVRAGGAARRRTVDGVRGRLDAAVPDTPTRPRRTGAASPRTPCAGSWHCGTARRSGRRSSGRSTTSSTSPHATPWWRPCWRSRSDLQTSRDLFDRLFIDVDMGSAATTSRVREAIAAAQLFFHRYLLDLQPVTLRPRDDGLPARPDEVKAELRRWWDWMKNYRVWEANRKVYLYPENYLRPELRDTKTPAFAVLEDDLLQGELTSASAERAFRRYLDEYTEVSRLTIAGGYVHEPADDDELPWHLVLFGRTKTDPRRYYYRRAEFSREASRSAQWHPWLKVDVQIDSDRVYPVVAFDRVFVFWATVEDVAGATPTVSFTEHTDNGTRSLTGGSQTTHVVTISYSFYNLNKEWVPAQVLTTELPIQDSRPISDVRLLVERTRTAAVTVDGVTDAGRETIVVHCSYVIQTDATTSVRRTVAVALTPELYTSAAPGGQLRRQRYRPVHQHLRRARPHERCRSARRRRRAHPRSGRPRRDGGGDRRQRRPDRERRDRGRRRATGHHRPQPAGPRGLGDRRRRTRGGAGGRGRRVGPGPDGRDVQQALRVVGRAVVQLRLQGRQLPLQARALAARRRRVRAGRRRGRAAAGLGPLPGRLHGPGREELVLQRGGPVRGGRPEHGSRRRPARSAPASGGSATCSPRPASWTASSPPAAGSSTCSRARSTSASAAGRSERPTPATRRRSRRTRTACPGGGGSRRRSPRPTTRPTTSTRTAAACRRRPPRTSSGRCATTGAGSHPTTRRRTRRRRRQAPRKGFFDDRELDSAFVWQGRTYLISGDEYIRYSTGSYQYADSDPQRLSTNTEGLPRSKDAVMFSDATSTYSIDNTAKTCTRTQGTSTETFPTGGPGERAVRRAARHRRGLRPRRAAVPGERHDVSSATRSPAGRSPTSSTPAIPGRAPSTWTRSS